MVLVMSRVSASTVCDHSDPTKPNWLSCLEWVAKITLQTQLSSTMIEVLSKSQEAV